MKIPPLTHTEAEIEEGAIVLAFFNRSPNAQRLPLTPRGFWKGWTPEAKEHYRKKVRAVLAAVAAGDADAVVFDAEDLNRKPSTHVSF